MSATFSKGHENTDPKYSSTHRHIFSRVFEGDLENTFEAEIMDIAFPLKFRSQIPMFYLIAIIKAKSLGRDIKKKLCYQRKARGRAHVLSSCRIIGHEGQ